MRRRVERAKEEWADAERRIRQRMRVYPKKLRAMLASRAEQELEIDQSDTRLPVGGQTSSPDPEEMALSMEAQGEAWTFRQNPRLPQQIQKRRS